MGSSINVELDLAGQSCQFRSGLVIYCNVPSFGSKFDSVLENAWLKNKK